ncbi:DUF1016 N-terminal domain-containing protein [Parapedobacter sp. DT-150]|uniref:DUF1016 N-terminal domain-containing protein n=1 Tax=Parapedobacter sp. DT-150 TaxID=3396162 RepID=UPI003F1C61EF
MDQRFTDIINLIKQARYNAIKAVNAELINLYWNIGEYISKRVESSNWGAISCKGISCTYTTQ